MKNLLALGVLTALLGACAAPRETAANAQPVSAADASAAAAAAMMGYHGPLRREDKRSSAD